MRVASHLIRDGRDAALSFLRDPPEEVRAYVGASDNARSSCAGRWRKEIGDARSLGRRVGGSHYDEVRWAEVVAMPESPCAGSGRSPAIPFGGRCSTTRYGRRICEAARAAAGHASHERRGELA